MSRDTAAIIPFDRSTARPAARWAERLGALGYEVLLAGPSTIEGHPTLYAKGKGDAIRASLTRVGRPYTLIVDPELEVADGAVASMLEPLREDRADGSFARRTHAGRSTTLQVERLLGAAAARGSDLPVSDPFSGLRAFRTEALRAVSLRGVGEDVDGELAVKLAAQAFRLVDVTVPLEQPPRLRWDETVERLSAVLRYGLLADAGDGEHEGYTTLHRMESAPHYNAWLAEKLSPHLGRRVLEVGAGIGTISERLCDGRELYLALERDPFYVQRLRNLFRDAPHVKVLADDAANTHWEGLREHRLDTIVLSNVLEHIEDDYGAAANFGRLLGPGGRVVILVPALPQLFGELDRAVGHFRRYTPGRLRDVLERNRFTVEKLEWMNVLGIPGWFVNGRLLRRRSLPPLQLRLYDRLAPWLARAEQRLPLPIGMSLLAVARYEGAER